MIRAVVKKIWEIDATQWPASDKAAIEYAREVRADPSNFDSPVVQLFCVHGRGHVLTGEQAEFAIAAGAADLQGAEQ